MRSPCSSLTSIADFRSSNLNKRPADILADKISDVKQIAQPIVLEPYVLAIAPLQNRLITYRLAYATL